MDEISRSLSEIHHFTSAQENALKSKLTSKKIIKGEFLLKPDQRCSFIAFVKFGSLRYFTYSSNDEQTLHFFTENQWLTDYESLITQQFTVNCLQATENSELLILTLNDLHELLAQSGEFRNLLKLLDKSIITSEHLTSISSNSPDERYRKLLMTNPEWINRFPQQHIASYLGMTKETFSRVKARVK